YFVCYLIRIVDTRKLIPFKVSHLRFAANLAALLLLAVNQRTGWHLWISLDWIVFAGLIALNCNPLLSTAKKILHRS
ncbi:MAG: capsular biosynthesis protein, partial [Oscillospiraceae bacterium]|nr:capsular biosynthesis protein [Oscillospiraceae bacterium]